jgi:hypothetical protein
MISGMTGIPVAVEVLFNIPCREPFFYYTPIIKEEYTLLKVIRHGSDRSTT